jgi:Transglutaminase-like superfamily
MKQLFKLLDRKYLDRKLILDTFILLGVIRLGLRFLPFQTLQNKLETASQLFPKTKEQLSVGKIVWVVNASSRYMPGGAKCLARALTAQVLMKQHGHSNELRIGVAKGETGELEAHAWIEHRGRVAIGDLSDLQRYVPMPSFKGSRL